MDQNAWIMLLVGVAISCALFALGVVLYPKLKSEKQGYPLEAEIESALLPIVFQGICAAYRVSENNMDTIHQRIKGTDKKKIAGSIYAMLPDKIGIFELTLVKGIVKKTNGLSSSCKIPLIAQINSLSDTRSTSTTFSKSGKPPTRLPSSRGNVCLSLKYQFAVRMNTLHG